VDRSIIEPEVFIKSNYFGVFNLLEELRSKPQIRLHQVSTDEVFGELQIEDVGHKFKEEMPFNPSSPYSASKAAADLLIKAYHRTYGLNVTISHCSNNYGPYQYPEKLIPKAIIFALHNKSIPIYGTGQNVRDWIHVLDHCSAIDMIIHFGKIGQSYNIGGDNEFSNLSVVKTILKVLDKNEGLIKFVDDRAGHDLRYAVDASKIVNSIGWIPNVNFEDGIKSTIRWYIKNHG
jgi:dTDP-glucose 4,6-dehydratase